MALIDLLRLRELRESRLVDVVESDGYGLTPLGRQLRRDLQPLVECSKRWARATSTNAVG